MEKKYLLAKWLNNELTATELAAFKATDDYAIYEKIKKHTSHLEVADFNDAKILTAILNQEKTIPKVIPLHKKWFFRVAAILVIALGLTYTIQNFATQTEAALYGKKTSFLLPDNSQVVLNSGSTIEYKKWNWDTHRNLKLHGEAYFKVAKGKRFEVTTNLGKVTVLGTQFDVKARKNRFDVVCFEGRVKVNYKQTQILLTHGQSVTFENGKQTNGHVQNTKPEWLDHTIAFNREHLNQIIEEIQRQYNITIELKQKNNNALFSGKIPTDNLDSALQIISTTYNLKYSKTVENTIIFEEK
jgi:transmembrane sensor